MTPRIERLRKAQWTSLGWLASHKLLGEDYWDGGRGARWVIGEEGTFTHRCEIIAGIGGSLLVHGDFDVVRFAHYSDHADAFSRLCWMGRCYDVDYYVAQKATIGLGRFGRNVWAYDEDVARSEIQALIDEARAECAHDATCTTETRLRFFLLALHRAECREELLHFADSAGRGEDFADVGLVLDPHVVTAHVALNKTVALLLDRYGLDGPPACQGHTP